MAFTSRADRNTSASIAVGHSTPATVGPGTYGSYFNQEVEHAYAPFSSTSEREAGAGLRPTEFVTPGPGAYDVLGRKYMGGPRYHSAPPQMGFLSVSSRMPDMPLEVVSKPGPGAYRVKSDFETAASPPRDTRPPFLSSGHNHRLDPPRPAAAAAAAALAPSGTAIAKRKGVIWFRAPTAPSIPRQDQAFGYEEGPAGVLVKQRPPVETHSGRPEDNAGPGEYDPSFDPTRPNPRGVDFGRSKVARVTPFTMARHVVPENVGPGTYQVQPPSFSELPAKHRRATATFMSRVLRPHQVDEGRRAEGAHRPVPGPGAYEIPDSFAAVRRSVPESQQCFGSTSRRQLTLAPRNPVPGPGSYDSSLRAAFGPPDSSAAAAGRAGGGAAPFLSTAAGHVTETKPLAPGPGAYDSENRNNFVALLAKRRFCRGGQFGSTTKRFLPSGKAEAEAPLRPGPGAYEPKEPKAVQGQLKRGPVAAFASTTNRFQAGGEAEGPAPGQYYKSAEWGSGYRAPEYAARTAFISSSKRFGPALMEQARKAAAPGPGAYSQEERTVGAAVTRIHKQRALYGDERMGPSATGGGLGFQATSARFPDSDALRTPGPGAYEPADPYGQLLKRSFNITVEGSA